MKKKVELLAPAGNMESLIAAVAGGCDAVYLGLQNFSARAFAGNFSHEEFQEAIRYCHIRGVKIYVTVNTMLYETEIANTIKEIDFLYHNDVDALLIQDMGLFHYVRTCYPDLDIHCSTQMHIHNKAGVLFMKEAGAARVVAARETPVSLLKEMCSCGIEVEAFVYGAICISYSGQCLMSSAMNHRSANKGVCAQCCRLQYYPEKGKHFAEGDYILSPKDLNVIERLPELIETGVCSLKIEGRMKRPEYVWLVTRTFREALDAYERGETYQLRKDQIRDLMLMFNRGFSYGHLFNASVKERMSQFRPNHMGLKIGTVLGFKNDRVQVRLSAPLYQHDGLRILNQPKDTGLTAVRIEKDGRLVSEAKEGDVVWLECRSRPAPKKGQPLHKTSDARLIESIDHMITDDPRVIPLKMTYTAYENEPLRITVFDNDGHTAEAESASLCQKPLKAPVTKERLEELLKRTGNYPYAIEECSGTCGEIFLPVSAVNETRRYALEKMNDLRAVQHPGYTEARPYEFHVEQKECSLPSAIVQNPSISAEENGISYIRSDKVRPAVDQYLSEKETVQGMLVSENGDLYMDLHDCIAGPTLNIANSYAAAWFLSQPGIVSTVLSSEISDVQCANLIEAFEKRYGFKPFLYRYVYGKRVLMYIKDGFQEGRPEQLVDFNGNRYKVAYNSYMAEILEPAPLSVERGACSGVYLNIDADSKKGIEEIVYEKVYGRI
ncbi:MAG: U32 family peptidase [Solobacterium sp.]|nr:U32 family peptidase [Solobacterium sp.]